MSLLVDTSVWSLALRRDRPQDDPHVVFLYQALHEGHAVLTTGIVLQELLQGIAGPVQRAAIVERLSALPAIVPDRQDHLSAAELHGHCRRNGIQAGTIDVLLASLCIRHNLTLLSTDKDFIQISRVSDLTVWVP